ncbi:MAG: hypothetical protein AAF936_05685 [Pseudomonadota bacterium]
MRHITFLFFIIAWVLAAGATARAEEIVRDPALIETMPIQGVTLGTPLEDAFNHLYAHGYRAGDIATYSEWLGSGLELVRGDYSSPDGESRIALSRANGHLVNISETFNRPRQKFDTHAEIQAIQDHFGIGPDDPNCRVNDHGTGACRVADAAEAANLVFGVNAFPTMILRYASRNKELKDAL